MDDLECLNWLPITGRIEFNLLKLAHKALYNETFTEYLSLSFRIVNAYNLRSACAPVIEVPRQIGTLNIQQPLHLINYLLILGTYVTIIHFVTLLGIILENKTFNHRF